MLEIQACKYFYQFPRSPPVCSGPLVQPELRRLLVGPAHVMNLGVGDSAELDASAVGAAHTALLPTEDNIA